MKVLTVVDEFTRLALAVHGAHSITARTVKTVLADLFARHGAPAVMRSACYQVLVNHALGGAPVAVVCPIELKMRAARGSHARPIVLHADESVAGGARAAERRATGSGPSRRARDRPRQRTT